MAPLHVSADKITHDVVHLLATAAVCGGTSAEDSIEDDRSRLMDFLAAMAAVQHARLLVVEQVLKLVVVVACGCHMLVFPFFK